MKNDKCVYKGFVILRVAPNAYRIFSSNENHNKLIAQWLAPSLKQIKKELDKGEFTP
jgi:hypothetical protein